MELLDANGVATGITTTTDATGAYSFTGLDAGIYGVTFTDTVTGLPLTTPNAGSDDTIDSDATDLGGGMSRILGIVVNAGQDTPDNDAGVTDPRTGEIGDRVWIDANRNGIQDAGELGLAGVTVTLTGAGADGAFGSGDDTTATTTTGTNGNYLFTGLAAGLYMVEFAQADGFDFTTQDAGADDALDSDAETGTGKTGPITLGQGESNLTVDAGLVKQNGAPTATDDAAKTCANETVTVDVLANDSDPDSDTLTITAVNGTAISEGGTVSTAAGDVTLDGGVLKVLGNANATVEALEIGKQGTFSFTYTVSDSKGGTADAKVDMTYCGTAETIADICKSLPKGTATFQIVDENNPAGSSGKAFTLKLSGTGDARFDGEVIAEAYCVSALAKLVAGGAGSNINLAPELTGNLYCTEDTLTGILSADAIDNLDLITWILNQDFGSLGYTDGEIQGAIWGLTDNTVFVATGGGDLADAQKILAAALFDSDGDGVSDNEGYEAGPGGIVAVVVAPDAATKIAGHEQPFIVGLAFDDLDCLC